MHPQVGERDSFFETQFINLVEVAMSVALGFDIHSTFGFDFSLRRKLISYFAVWPGVLVFILGLPDAGVS
jgi:hypothetical protein